MYQLCVYMYIHMVIPRPFQPPVLGHLQYANMKGEDLAKYGDVRLAEGRYTGGSTQPN